ncbi:MAG TPA: hypothetical protein VMW54_04570 [Terriglobia bacterium]|nr:hypothetical protein [Terriglobia bacterium]
MKWKQLITVLFAIGIAGIGALAFLRHSDPPAKAVTRDVPATAPAAKIAPPPATLNKAAYNAKMLALANLPPPKHCAPSTARASAKAAPARILRTGATSRPVAFVTTKEKAVLPPCPAPLWPVHTAYPDAGALLPFKRIVAYYGNFYSKRMGILGEYPPDKMLAMLSSQAAAWAAADPSTPVVQALDYIVVSAQGLPGRDGRYRMRMPASHIEKAISLADQIHGLVFLDVQPGWSTVEAEVTRLEPYLKQPNVELALDPEFALVDGKRPGAWIGTMNAGDINFAARFLAKLVQENHLPPKILVVHRFTERMVTGFRAIKPLPEVEVVMDMDGFGSPVLKRSTYRSFVAAQPVQFTGFKLFYKNDVNIGHHLMTPAEVLSLSPQPSFILYQ